MRARVADPSTEVDGRPADRVLASEVGRLGTPMAALIAGGPSAVLALQRAVGNRSVASMLKAQKQVVARCAGGCTCGGKCGAEELLDETRARAAGTAGVGRAVRRPERATREAPSLQRPTGRSLQRQDETSTAVDQTSVSQEQASTAVDQTSVSLQATGNRATRRLLAREPEDEIPGVRDPGEGTKIGGAEGEREEVGRVRIELEKQGYDKIYNKTQMARPAADIAEDKGNPKPFDRTFADGRARPEIIAINTQERKVLSLDLTKEPGTTTKLKPGDRRPLPNDAPSTEQVKPHFEKTLEDAKQIARRPPGGQDIDGFKVVAQERYWATGEYSPEVDAGKIIEPSPSVLVAEAEERATRWAAKKAEKAKQDAERRAKKAKKAEKAEKAKQDAERRAKKKPKGKPAAEKPTPAAPEAETPAKPAPARPAPAESAAETPAKPAPAKPAKPPPGSSADPTAGPPEPFRKGPNFKPTPHDSPPPERTGGGRGGADTQAPAMEFEGSNVKLYRGVGTVEAADLMAYHEWSYSPSGSGKYFAFTKQDAMNAAAKLYPEGATIVEISVPRAIVPTTIDQPLLVHHPHLSSHTGEATMIEGEVNVFYDPRAGGWSLHVDDEALDVVNAEMTAPKIHDSSFPTIGAESAPAAEHPPAPAAEPPPAAPATATEQVRTYGPGEVKEDFVAKMAAEQESQLLRPGRYVRIGGMVYAMVWVGGALLFLNDVIARGPIEAGKTWGIMGILTERIAMTAGGAVAGAVSLLLFMPSDQAGGAEQLEAIEKADVLDGMIHDAFPDIVGPRRVLCIGDCTAGNRHIFEPELFRKIRAQMEVAVAHAWTIEDDEAIRRRKRREAVAAEHRHELEKDRAREAEVDEMMNAWRTRPTGFYVSASVGDEAINKPDDVQRTAKRLHELGFLDKSTTDLDELGSAIYQYQYSILHQAKPDSRVDPRGATEAALRAGKRVSMAL